ncbi:MAG: esterase [Burkholderiales bacterium]|nr:esterase [Burkholderiales bacterium]MDE2566635.1 esterase [Burkholderiales bacterium]
MIFSSKATPRPQRAVAGVPTSIPGHFLVRFRGRFLGLCLLGLLAACGGGTSQNRLFVPSRLVVLGDETSVITPTGTKYSVNGLDSSGNVDCTQQPIWVQSLAANYGLTFNECNPQSLAVTALMLAQPGAQVADVAAQVAAQVAAGGFRPGDLATVLAGTNDILQLYAQFPGRSVADLSAEAGARGKQLALVVNSLVNLGVKVVVSDLPDVGLTPYAIAQQALDPLVDRAAVLSQLTTAFNQQLGVNIVLDGRFVGLVQAQLQFQAIARFPSGFGLSDIVTPICTVALPNCSTATLIPNATTTGYLWADDTHLSPAGQSQLASLAIARARNNPF